MWVLRGLILLGLASLAFGLGFHYTYEPRTGNSALETHLPGSEPILNWNTGVSWNRLNYGRSFDSNGKPGSSYFNYKKSGRRPYGVRYDRNGKHRRFGYSGGEPVKYRHYDAASSDYRYTCEAGAYFSESHQRCFWYN